METITGFLLLLAVISLLMMAKRGFREESPYQAEPERTAYFVALRILKDPDLAEDIVSEIKIRILEQGYKPNNPQAYMAAAARYGANKHLRSQRKFVPLDDIDLSSESDVEQEYIARECLGRLNRALQALPPHQREELYRRYYMDSSYDEISKTLNISRAAAKARVQRAVVALRDKL